MFNYLQAVMGQLKTGGRGPSRSEAVNRNIIVCVRDRAIAALSRQTSFIIRINRLERHTNMLPHLRSAKAVLEHAKAASA